MTEIIFKKQNFFEQNNENVIKEITDKLDLIYKNFYIDNKRLIMIYVFIFILMEIDIQSLLIAMSCTNAFKKQTKKTLVWILSIPSLITCILSIAILIIYKYRKIHIKKLFVNILNKSKVNLKYATDENIHVFSKKLKLRMKYYKHNIFEIGLEGIILFLLPIFLKIIVFQKTKFEIMFSISSSLFYGVTICHSIYILIKTKIKKRCKRKTKKLNYYIQKYPSFDKLKEIKIKSEKNRSLYSNLCMTITFFMNKLFFGFLFIIFFKQIGEKLDDPKNGSSWLILFIPCYILFIPVICFAILHTISLYPIFKAKIWLIILTIFPCIFAFIANSFLMPLEFEKRIEVSPYIIPILFFSASLFFVLHLKIIYSKIKD